MFNLSTPEIRQELLSAFLSVRYSEFTKPFNTYKSTANFLRDQGFAVVLKEYKGPYTQSKIELTPPAQDLFKMLEVVFDAGWDHGREDTPFYEDY